MANVKISELVNLTDAVANGDIFPLVDVSSGTTKGVYASNIKTYCSTSPTLITPNLGVATATSIHTDGLNLPVVTERPSVGVAGDIIIIDENQICVCIVGGTPGTWYAAQLTLWEP